MGTTLEALTATLAFPALVHIAQILPNQWSTIVYLRLLKKPNLGEWPITMHSDVSEKHNAFEGEAFLCVCGVLHVVVLHSGCIMAPLWLVLKALQGRFADTCLR